MGSSLKDKKCARITNLFQKILNESRQQPNNRKIMKENLLLLKDLLEP